MTRRHLDDVVLRPDPGGHQGSRAHFRILHAAAGGIGVELRVPEMAAAGERDAYGIDAAAQRDAHTTCGFEAPRNGAFENARDARKERLERLTAHRERRSGRVRDLPRLPARIDREHLSRSDRAHRAEEHRAVHRQVLGALDALQNVAIDGGVEARQRHQRLVFRGECDPAVFVGRPEERFHAKEIAAEEQRLREPVPEREREVTFDVLDQGCAEPAVAFEERLGRRIVPAALGIVLFTNPPVHDERVSRVRGHVPASRPPCGGEHHAPGWIGKLVLLSPVPQPLVHAAHRLVRRTADRAKDRTHGNASLRRAPTVGSPARAIRSAHTGR